MNQFNIHKDVSFAPLEKGSVPIVRRLTTAYELWHEHYRDFPKTSRYSLGLKIDSMFVETISLILSAAYLPRQEKMPFLLKAGNELDLLKFFLQIAWELKLFDNKKYIALSKQLNDIGCMLGGWRKQLMTPAPLNKTGLEEK